MCVYVYVWVSLSICLFIYLSINQPINNQSTSQTINQSINQSFLSYLILSYLILSIYLSIYLSILLHSHVNASTWTDCICTGPELFWESCYVFFSCVIFERNIEKLLFCLFSLLFAAFRSWKLPFELFHCVCNILVLKLFMLHGYKVALWLC